MILALAVFTIWDETSNGPPRMIHGKPDDAPMYAALFLAFLTPAFYVMFALLNWIDSRSDRLRNPLPWLTSGLVTMVLAILMTKVFYVPGVDTGITTGIAMASVTAVLAVWPMSLLRRFKYPPGQRSSQ